MNWIVLVFFLVFLSSSSHHPHFYIVTMLLATSLTRCIWLSHTVIMYSDCGAKCCFHKSPKFCIKNIFSDRCVALLCVCNIKEAPNVLIELHAHQVTTSLVFQGHKDTQRLENTAASKTFCRFDCSLMLILWYKCSQWEHASYKIKCKTQARS